MVALPVFFFFPPSRDSILPICVLAERVISYATAIVNRSGFLSGNKTHHLATWPWVLDQHPIRDTVHLSTRRLACSCRDRCSFRNISWYHAPSQGSSSPQSGVSGVKVRTPLEHCQTTELALCTWHYNARTGLGLTFSKGNCNSTALEIFYTDVCVHLWDNIRGKKKNRPKRKPILIWVTADSALYLCAVWANSSVTMQPAISL